jgi:N-acetylglucosaminyldiphosphoundecaprenol N-acetyl-beta-D-mannosaminyltransferase
MSPAIPRIDLLGTRVSALSFIGAQDALAELVARGVGGYVSPATAYSLVLGLDDAHYLARVNAAALVTSDGMPVVWALRRCGQVAAERVHNDDLALACCARFGAWRHYLVGGRVGQPEQVAAALRLRFPGIAIVGMTATPLRPVPDATTRAIVTAIAASRADVVWVGLGTPAQDDWMHAVAAEVRAPMVGVGSLFDLLAGRTRAAPDWVKRSGLQWLFRLLQEPRRLARRYLVCNTRFVLALARQWLKATRGADQQ